MTMALFHLLFCILDIYMFFRFFASMFPKRGSAKRRCAYSAIVVFVALSVNSFGVTWLNLALMPIVLFFYAMVEFHISQRNSAVYTLIFYAIFAGGETAFEIFHRFLSTNQMFPAVSWITGNGVPLLMIDYIFRFLFLLFIERFTKKIEADQDTNFSWYLLITPIVSMLVLTTFMCMEFPEEKGVQLLICIGAFLLYFSNAVMFIILERYTAIMNRIRCEEVYKARQEISEDHLQNMIGLNEKYRCYMHDVHAYLSNLRILAMDNRNQEIVQIINEMEGGIQEEIENKVYSGNAVLNAVLTERAARANRDGIDMHIFVENFLRMDFISDADMISMFGNLLDNALEAAGQCEEGSRRVEAKLFMGNEYMLVLCIQNSFVTPVRWSGDKLLTTKQDDRMHGLGTGIVKKLAEKYGGTLSLQEEENIFVTTLMISARNTR